jgi:hypothetical protein
VGLVALVSGWVNRRLSCRVSTVRFPQARCLRMNRGRQIVFRFSRGGWMRVALRKQVVRLGDVGAPFMRSHRMNGYSR